MTVCIWYVSKYVSPPAKASVGGRGYLIMREFARMGYRSVIVTSDSNHLAEVPQLEQTHLLQTIDGIQLIWVRTMKYKVAKSFKRILSWLDFEWRLWCLPKSQLPAPDVIIVSSLSLLTIFNGLLLRSHYKCRLVLEIRDIWPLTIVEEGGFNSFNPFVLALGWVEKLGYKYTDAIVGTMPNLGEHVANVIGYTKSTYCIPMGIDEETLNCSNELPAEYLGKYIPKDKFIVVHAGTIGITNALHTLLDCAASMQNNSNVHFLIVGKGDLKAQYQTQYAHLSNLTFAPPVSKNMVQAVLSHCDLLYFSVHPSKVWQYGQSLNKVIDYMYSGKPIVASYTGFQSMLNEAHCGTFVPAGNVKALSDEIVRHATMDKNELRSIGQRGRDWVLANRDYKILAENYLKILFNKN